MRPLYVTAAILIAMAVLAQEIKHPVLSSHDKVHGPLAGQYHLEDLQIFEGGKVVYVEEVTKAMSSDQPERSIYETAIGSDEMRHLTELLDSSEIRSLSEEVPPKTMPIDFFWEKSIEIDRSDKTQRIQIENFYPFLNLQEPVYPNALIELECSLQDIKTAAAKRARPSAADDWCKALVSRGKASSSRATGTSVEPAQADCRADEVQPKIVADEGWGPIRVGAAFKTVDAFLGEGQPIRRSLRVYFKDYPSKGVQVSFEDTTDTVHAIFFYNRQRDSEEFEVFCGQTDKSINWQASVEDVKKTYGQPTSEFSGTYGGIAWKRLVFEGIDFRFENGKMVRIAVPGN